MTTNRTIKTTTRAKTKPTFRRAVRRVERVGDRIGFKTKSFTRDDGTEYRATLDVASGQFSCTCPGAFYRPAHPCKHVLRAAHNAIRRGEAPPTLLSLLGLRCCYRCHATEGVYGMVYDDGRNRDQMFICASCAAKARALSPLAAGEVP